MPFPGKGHADYLELGDWNAVCFQCGFKFKASELRRQWQGFWSCESCWEPRQPQDFVRAIPDVQTPPWVQPRPTAIFAISDFLCTESSDESTFEPMIYICTETLYPLETET